MKVDALRGVAAGMMLLAGVTLIGCASGMAAAEEPEVPACEVEVSSCVLAPELEPVAVEEPEPEPEVWYEEEYYEEEVYYYEPEEVYYEPEPVDDGSVPNLKRDGRVYADGSEWTWYSENALPGGGLTDLNENGRTVNDGGYVTDGDGYIAIASPDESVPIGTEIDTPWGPGKIYDYNDGGSYDVYTSW